MYSKCTANPCAFYFKGREYFILLKGGNQRFLHLFLSSHLARSASCTRSFLPTLNDGNPFWFIRLYAVLRPQPNMVCKSLTSYILVIITDNIAQRCASSRYLLAVFIIAQQPLKCKHFELFYVIAQKLALKELFIVHF